MFFSILRIYKSRPKVIQIWQIQVIYYWIINDNNDQLIIFLLYLKLVI